MSPTIGAAALGFWEEAAFLVFLYGSAEAVESLTFARTRSAIRALLDLAPKEAHVLRDGAELTVPATELVPGDVFLVRPGESLATDGVIRTGASSLDESPITGESVPVDKAPGDQVFAGTINRQGALTIEATKAFADNTLSAIIHLVEEAQGQKGHAQRFIDRFSRIYSPLVLVGAALFAIVPIALGGDPTEWITRAITVVVAGGAVRARHVDPGRDGRRDRLGRPARRPHQGRRPPREPGHRPGRRARQDGHADLRPPGRDRHRPDRRHGRGGPAGRRRRR